MGVLKLASLGGACRKTLFVPPRRPAQAPKHFPMATRVRTTKPADKGPAIGGGRDFAGEGFLSAEDFDATGILTGVEPCASSYWWIPELLSGSEAPSPMAEQGTVGLSAPPPSAVEGPFGERQAARRIVSRSTAAA